jgi:CDP-diacylglycerol--serine O-phosphatidyltransferase
VKRGIYILPNFLTICSLFLGFYAIIASIRGSFEYAAWAIMGSTIFDALDGWVARLTHSNTKFGIEFDSLSDLIAFGMAPGILVYMWALKSFGRIGWVGAFLFVVCGALRLARYNVQMGSSEAKYFTGLPIPGAAITMASLVIFYTELWGTLINKNYFVLFLTYILAFLMVSTLRYHSIKEIDIRRRKPFGILVAIVLALVIIVINPAVMLFVFSMVYVLWGLVEGVILHQQKRLKTKKAVIPEKKA